jgi:agmatinase
MSARDIHETGVAPLLDMIPLASNVLLSLDVDGLDPAIVPAVFNPAPGGLNYWHMIDLIHGASQRARLCGFSIAELMPERDIDGLSALTAARIVMNVVGAIARSV